MVTILSRLCLASVCLSTLSSMSAFAETTPDKGTYGVTATVAGEVTPTAATTGTLNDKAAKFDSIDKHELIVEFSKSKSSLTNADKEGLDTLLKALPPKTKRLKLTIAAWSDKAFPMDKDVKLSSADEKLAEKRVDSIVRYLKQKVKFDSVEKVNMAKQANMFSQYFSTDEAKVKAAFEGSDPKKPWVAYEAKKLRDNGGPSKAMLIIYDKVGLDE